MRRGREMIRVDRDAAMDRRAVRRTEKVKQDGGRSEGSKGKMKDGACMMG